MNYSRVLLAGLAGSIAYFAVGGLLFGLAPQLRDEFRKYPAVYRDQEAIKSVMPLGMAAMFVSVVVLAALYALAYRGGPGVWEGARFGFLVGLFAVGAFVLHNYVNLQIGLSITGQQALAYMLEWLVVGIVIGVVYRPPVLP
jgi:hypothetical protein